MRILSFSSYFLLKKPLKQEPFSGLLTMASALVSTAGLAVEVTDADFAVDAVAVFGFVDLVLDFADDLGFFVAIIPPLFDIIYIISQKIVI